MSLLNWESNKFSTAVFFLICLLSARSPVNACALHIAGITRAVHRGRKATWYTARAARIFRKIWSRAKWRYFTISPAVSVRTAEALPTPAKLSELPDIKSDPVYSRSAQFDIFALTFLRVHVSIQLFLYDITPSIWNNMAFHEVLVDICLYHSTNQSPFSSQQFDIYGKGKFIPVQVSALGDIM